ncbi:tetratricopeptide repeat protein [Dictyobacter aurantiacus]|uniref:Uncharacterized protein n=1 Tax=Dictyobacter aurantiacus TaxID=1936993 RepID=A0A401ZHD0_9CHLR|nr:tetratricopeptide repeat protein [Dictyobacter aurantiacus]GCE06291.1 hypothetical protein KDAU_36200 [Dictyobacter aurantiacus]
MTDQDKQNKGPEGDVALLQQFEQIARALNASEDPAEAKALLEPFTSQPENVQIALLKTLGTIKTTAAADIIQAINALSDNKEIRKEARRRLIQLENEDVYAEWTIPTGPTLTETIESFTQSDEPEEDSFMSELQSLFGQAEGLMGAPEHLDTVTEFLQEWGNQHYDEVAGYLSKESPLREGLSEEDWVARRQSWAEKVRPDDLQISFIEPIEDEQGPDIAQVDVGWSIRLTPQPTLAVPECPQPTISFKETGRGWFWTRYTVVFEDEEWRIHDFTNEAARLNELSLEELQQSIDNLSSEIEEISQDIEDETEELEEAEEDVEDEEEGEDWEDEEEEEEEDLEEMQLLASTLGNMSSMIRMIVQLLHHHDALIAKAPQENEEIFRESFDLAGGIADVERAACYAQLMAEKLPESRGEALRNLAYSYHAIAARFHNNDDHEEEERFDNMVEPTIREALQVADTPANHVLLATILIQHEEKLDEAEAHLREAQKGPLTQEDAVDVAMGLAEIAMQREDNEEALKHFKELSRLTPDDAQVWYRIGYLQHQMEHFKEASEALQRSIEMAPELTEAYTELASIYLVQGNAKKALEVAHEGLDNNPDAADMYATMALIYMQSGDFRSADRYLSKGESLDSDDEFLQEARARYNAESKQRRGPQGPNKSKSRKAKKK